MRDPRTQITAVARFHAATSGRVGLRNAIVLYSAVAGLVAAAPDPIGLAHTFVRGVVGETGAVRMVLAALAVGFALPGSRALNSATRGWFGSLPVSRVARVAGAALGVQVVLLPLGSVLLVMVIGTGATGLLDLVGFAGTLVLLATAAAVPVALQRQPRLVRRRRSSVSGGWRRRWLMLSWRALGWQVLLPLLAPLPVFAGGWFYRTNNELTANELATASRVVGVAAVTLCLGAFGDRLARLRPVWTWARSLPMRASDRVTMDCVVLGIPTLIVAIVAAGVMRSSLSLVAPAIPVLIVTATALLPDARARISGLSGPLWVVGALCIPGLMWPLPRYAMVATVPALFALSAARDRGQPISRWCELYHDADGDPESWRE